ncbi:MAG: hypothetical protein QOH04_1844 [Sphingomonadales bacterium]|jgi:hypothetical protein|nr:hypothetical protein [Sphingomonadales bacterium]
MVFIRSGQLYAVNPSVPNERLHTRYTDGVRHQLQALAQNRRLTCSLIGFTAVVEGKLVQGTPGAKRLELTGLKNVRAMTTPEIETTRQEFLSPALRSEPIC